MSEQLDRLEKIANQKVVNDEAQVADIMGWFLGSRLMSHVPNNAKNTGYMRFMKRDLKAALKLDDATIEKFSIGDALMTISHEKDNDYFSVPYVKNGELAVKIRRDAGHCYYLMGILHLYNKRNVRLIQLMHIDFDCFISFLKNAIRAEKELGNISDITYKQRSNMMIRLNNECKVFMEKYSATGMLPDASFILGELIETAYRVGNRPWLCNMEELKKHAYNTVNAFRIAEILFGDLMTGILVAPNAKHYSKFFSCEMERQFSETDAQTGISK